MPSAVVRLARIPHGIHEDAAIVSDALCEAVACLQAMWEWQSGQQALLPEGLADRVQTVLRNAGVNS